MGILVTPCDSESSIYCQSIKWSCLILVIYLLQHRCNTQDEHHSIITVMECITADGQVIPPMYIDKVVKHLLGWHGDVEDAQQAICQSSAWCKAVPKKHANLPDTPVDISSAAKYFLILPGPLCAKQCALNLGRSSLRCFWQHLQ